jgi:hypothetical protein
MADDDDDNNNNNNDDDDDNVVIRRFSNINSNNMACLLTPFGLPASVVEVLGRMAPYGDRLSWTVVENSRVVSLALNWDIQRRQSLAAATSDGRDGGGGGGYERVHPDAHVSDANFSSNGGGVGAKGFTSAAKDSLWSRIRRTLQHRRNRLMSVNGLAAVVAAAVSHERRQNGNQLTSSASAVTSSSSSSIGTSSGVGGGPSATGSGAVGVGRARTAREMWRKSVERDRAAQAMFATGAGGDGTSRWSRGASWSPGRTQGEKDDAWGNSVDPMTSTDRDYLRAPEYYNHRAPAAATAAASQSVTQYWDARRGIRRLQPSMSLPERFVPAIPASHSWQPDQEYNSCCHDNTGGHVSRRQQSLSVNVGLISALD